MAYRSQHGSSANQQLVKSERSMLTLSDDNVMLKQIMGTHAPDGREVDVKPLLFLTEDILNRATLQVDASVMGRQGQIDSIEDKSQQANFVTMLEALSYTIDRISCELSYKALGGSDAHSTTLSIFNMLSNYPWDAKLVLALAAFALNYGEFWLLAQIYSTNQLAKSMAILRQLPSIMEHSGPLKSRFEGLNTLIKVMVDVTKCVVEFKELPPTYISPDIAAFQTALTHIPTAVYWIIRSIVACASQITTLSSMSHEFAISTTESWELSTLAHKLKNIHDHLKEQLVFCYDHIEDRRNNESFKILKTLFESVHIDNMKVLKALISVKDDSLPLIDGSSKRRVNLEVLRRKNVLLLISGLDFSHDELAILEQIYNESRMHATRLESQYEIVWIPIVDRSVPWTEPMQKQFESLQVSMPWYSVHHPTIIEKPVVRFIKEVWHLRNKPILVVLDPQGRLVCPNAIHMMWIWGSNAFPFTSLREEALWKEETWRLELLVDGIDPTILNWIREEKYIFLYGGDDPEWVRKFTNQAKAMAEAARVPMEMVYVGKSSKREQVRRVIATITVEKLSYCWQDPTMIWFFWTRLESMLFSKIQLGRVDDHTDPTMQQIKKLLSYDKEGGWAVLAKGSEVVVNGHSTTILPTVFEYDSWKEHVITKGFDVAIRDYHDMLHGVSHPCCRFEFLNSAGRIPETMRCPECNRAMEKYTTFLCCHDEGQLNVIRSVECNRAMEKYTTFLCCHDEEGSPEKAQKPNRRVSSPNRERQAILRGNLPPH
ncbi:hypothetical protein ACFE04_009142 [Oxalis oulophora]